MRWHFRFPEPGDIRTHRRFAWLPVVIDNEARWLEVVTSCQQRVVEGYEEYTRARWKDLFFIDW